jgi:hypothetical protein
VTDGMSLTDAQLQRILGAISALNTTAGIHRETVVPVFLSALLAMCVGIALEYFKDYRNRNKADLKRRKDELTEINSVVIDLAYNMELLIHIAFQNIIPHIRLNANEFGNGS